MTNDKATFILVVLDESGSMGSKRQDVIGGFNTFMQERRQDPSPCRVSLIKFNTRPTRVFDAKPPAASFRSLSESTSRFRRKAGRASRDFLRQNGNSAN
jgi:hypothetical protein